MEFWSRPAADWFWFYDPVLVESGPPCCFYIKIIFHHIFIVILKKLSVTEDSTNQRAGTCENRPIGEQMLNDDFWVLFDVWSKNFLIKSPLMGGRRMCLPVLLILPNWFNLFNWFNWSLWQRSTWLLVLDGPASQMTDTWLDEILILSAGLNTMNVQFEPWTALTNLYIF